MSLRRKTSVYVGITFLCLLTILSIIPSTFIFNGIKGFEIQNAQRDLTIAFNSLQSEISSMDTVTENWATWDDSYNFINDSNQDFIKTNLTDAAFSGLKLNFLIYVDHKGKIVYKRGFDYKNGVVLSPPSLLDTDSIKGSLLLKHENLNKSVSGFVDLPEGPALVVSRPILTSHGEGPSRGSLIMGRYLDSQISTFLAEKNHMSLSFYKLQDTNLPNEIKSTIPALVKNGSQYIYPINENTIAGYALIKDIYGKPFIVLKMQEPRQIYNQGKTGLYHFIFWIFIAIIFFGLIINVLLEKTILKRISILNEHVSEIGKHRDFSIRLPVTGDDEISNLSSNANNMLEVLESHIKELQAKTEELEESKLYMETLFNIVGDGIGVVRFDGKIKTYNQALLDIYGYTSEEFDSKTLDKFFPENEIDKFNQVANDVLEKGYGHFECTNIRKDNTKFPAEVRVNLMKYKSDEPTTLVFKTSDITERKKAEEALKYSEKKFRTIFEQSSVGIHLYDQEGYLADINNSALQIWGIPNLQSIDKTSLFKVPKFPEEIKTKMLSGEMVSGEFKFDFDYIQEHKLFVTTNHGFKYFDIIATPLNPGKAEFSGYLILSQDITDRKNLEQALINKSEEQSLLLDNIETQIWYMTDASTYGAVNKAHANFHGLDKSELEGKKLYDVPHWKNSIDEYIEVNNKIFNSKKQFKYEMEIEGYNGNVRLLSIIKTPKLDKDGTVEYIVCSAEDITERKKAEQEILHLSFSDKLTGLHNRAFFERELKRLDVSSQLPLCVIIGDLNGLKITNDVFGHAEGDNLLCKIAEILKESCRKDDIIARWGGDEFAVILPQTTEKTSNEICEQIRKACLESEGNLIHPSIALGTASKCSDDQNIQDILKEAENRMYRHKLLEDKSARSSIISFMEKTLFERSYETEEHAQRLRKMAIRMGSAIGLSDNELDELNLLAALHDIGKIAIPDNILMKPGKLTHEEWEIMKNHSEIGYRIAKSCPEFATVADAILSHHEKWDGTGYPRGLKANEIEVSARILTIVDTYDAMTHKRPYNKPVSKDEALEEIVRHSGKQFDPELVKVFTELMKETPELEDTTL